MIWFCAVCKTMKRSIASETACVAWSAVDAARLGFQVSVIEAATRAIDLNGSREGARQTMLDAGVRLL